MQQYTQDIYAATCFITKHSHPSTSYMYKQITDLITKILPDRACVCPNTISNY